MLRWRGGRDFTIIAVDCEGSEDLDARVSGGYDHDRLLSVWVRVVGVRLSHDQVQFTPWVSRTRAPPFRSVQHVLVPVAADLEVDVLGIGARSHPLRHHEGTADFAVQQRHQPLLLLRIVAVFRENLHVACVGGGAVHGLAGDEGSAQELGHEAIFEVGESDALLVVDLGEEEIPETERSRLGLQVIDDGWVDVEETLGGV